MATALQKQLAAIAVKSTHELDHKAKRAAHGKSLLFDAKVAVSQDFNSIFQLCREGFDELCSLDPRFAPYASSLFSEQSKDEEREMMTAAQNQQLDTVLQDFLGLVQARLLLKPAQKAVEWLVRRFRVHEYNTDWLILTFLPYHSTPLFAALLAILPAQLSDAFRFLYPYVPRLANPPFVAIVKTATTNVGFFTALNNYVLKVCHPRHHSSSLLSFWTSVVTQAVDGMLVAAQSGREAIRKQRHEEVLLRVLPVLNEALSLRDIPDLVIGSCTVITILAAKAPLSDAVLDGLMEAVAGNWSPATTSARIMCLTEIAQERHTADIPRPVVKKLLAVEDVTTHLEKTAELYRADRLILGLALGCVTRVFTSSTVRPAALLEWVVSNAVLDLAQMVQLTTHLLVAVNELPPEAVQGRDTMARIVTLLAESEYRPVLEETLQLLQMDRDAVELTLHTVLPAPEVQPTEDVAMADVDAPAVDTFSPALAALAAEKTTVSSFLSEDAVMPNLVPVFLQGMSSQGRLEQVLALPILRKDAAHTEPTYLSFLIRIWSGHYPQVARRTALLLAARVIKKHKVDFQFLVPYLVVALLDKSDTVRQAAADGIVALSKVYKSLEKGTAVWGDGLYHTKIDPLSTQEASDLVRKVLAPDVQECALDADTAATVIVAALNGSTPESKLQVGNLELKSSRRTAFSTALARHAAATPLLPVSHGLLSLLARAGKAASAARSDILLPYFIRWIDYSDSGVAPRCAEQRVAQADLELEMARILTAREPASLQLLQQILSGERPLARDATQTAVFARLGEIWPSIKSPVREQVASSLLTLSLARAEDTTARLRCDLAAESLKTLSLPTDVLVVLVDALPKAVQMPEGPSAKRRRTSRNEMARVETNITELDHALRQYTQVLELVDGSPAGEDPALLPGLFRALGEIQHYRSQTGSELVYLQTLAINALLALVNKIKDTKAPVDQGVIRTDLLVDCVRHTSNPQIQNSALLLISCLATWVPDIVLHSVMPIFTFMSATILRQGDDYSAHVIDQTVSHVVPPLVASLKKRSRNVVQGASDLLLSFTAAFEHIPSHRRLGLFENVARTLGPEDSLYAVIAMIVDRYPTDQRARRFAADLLDLFDPKICLKVIRQYVDLIADIFAPRRSISETVLNLKDKPEQVEPIAGNLLSALADLLNDTKFRAHLAASFGPDCETQREAFSQLLQNTIKLSQTLKAHPALTQGSALVLANVFKLLPMTELVKCAEPLLELPQESLRQVVLRSIGSHAATVKNMDQASRIALLQFVPRISAVVQGSDDILLKHSAITCIDQITEQFGKKDTSYILPAARVVAGPDGLAHADDRLRVISLLCLTSILDVVQDEFIPLLPTVLPLTYAHLRAALAGDGVSMRESVVNAAFTLVNSVAERLPFMFIGEYLDEALELAQLSAVSTLKTESAENRALFYQAVVANVDAEALLAAFAANYEKALKRDGFAALVEFVEALKAAVERQSKAVVIKHSSVLFQLVLGFLDHRRLNAAAPNDEFRVVYSVEEVDAMEARYNDVALAVVLKLNDATFRPLFVRVVEWASALPKKDRNGRALRSVALFKLLTTLFERLKSLITSYSSYIIELSADLLQTTKPSNPAHITLLQSVLSALDPSFEHDQDDFWQAPSHFTPLCNALVTALQHSASNLAILPLVINTVASLAGATSSADQHKELNTLILKLMRSDDPAVRLAAVRTGRSLTERLGEEWLAMLAEMLPFVAELLEDGEEQVEKETRAWVRMIEGVLGESLEF
ncbi:hypothetical protein EJ06DRAFT_500915 [Trichodelitschia bisporula]|uniref:U3 small nucleolar RNA-associated protein 10 n=1 Tax=Trichodelitschia bisporula TaxID=703511 RepID=A0A6G1HJ33_9PEZI|nr:hypothetical protein EJ06DRAFT_500915 [Trichodelitschia bisporula]